MIHYHYFYYNQERLNSVLSCFVNNYTTLTILTIHPTTWVIYIAAPFICLKEKSLVQ